MLFRNPVLNLTIGVMELFNGLIYSWFSRSNTARGSSTCPVTVGPTKVKASKSLLFTKDPSVNKRKNTC